MGADTNSRADAAAVRGLTGGLRFELAQAADIIQRGAADTLSAAERRQVVRRDTWFLALHQEDGDVRSLSENVAVLLATYMGELDSVVRDGATAGSVEGQKAVDGLIEYAKKNAEGAMEEIDETLDLGEGAREELEGAIRSYFASLA